MTRNKKFLVVLKNGDVKVVWTAWGYMDVVSRYHPLWFRYLG